MKKIYNLIFAINIILGLFIFSSSFIFGKFSLLSLTLLVILSIIYIICALVYSNKKYKSYNSLDFHVINTCLLFMIFLFVFGVLSQMKHMEVYCLVYYNFYLYLIHVLLTIYFLIR